MVKIYAALDASPNTCFPRELKDAFCLTQQRPAYFHVEIRSVPIHMGKKETDCTSFPGISALVEEAVGGDPARHIY